MLIVLGKAEVDAADVEAFAAAAVNISWTVSGSTRFSRTYSGKADPLSELFGTMNTLMKTVTEYMDTQLAQGAFG